jgi:phosphoribosylglycinamide formyltransferase 1
MLKIAVLVSGSGSNLQSIIDSIKCGYLSCSIEIVISDRPGTYGIERAKDSNMNTVVLDRKIYGSRLSQEILNLLANKVDLIVLAGWLSILEGSILKTFKNRIINIHPSLIPAFCGNGMYGKKVHEAVLSYGVKVSGCTVHFVDEGTDSGPIIMQKTVPVFATDSIEDLQGRILMEEHRWLPEAIKYISEGKVKVEGRKVIIEGK